MSITRISFYLVSNTRSFTGHRINLKIDIINELDFIFNNKTFEYFMNSSYIQCNSEPKHNDMWNN